VLEQVREAGAARPLVLRSDVYQTCTLTIGVE